MAPSDPKASRLSTLLFHLLTDRDLLLRESRRISSFLRDCRKDQRQTADAPPEHQQDQYPMRKLSELRRYAERQAYRPDGGCCFIQADGKRKIFCRADDTPAGEKQRQIQQQNGRSAFYNAAVDAAVKKLRPKLLFMLTAPRIYTQRPKRFSGSTDR